MKTNLLKSIFISLILVLGVSNAWAGAGLFEAYLQYDNSGVKTTIGDFSSETTTDIGNVTSLSLTGFWIKTWCDNSTVTSDQLVYRIYSTNTGEGSTQYQQRTTKGSKVGNDQEDSWTGTIKLVDASTASSVYYLKYQFEAWFGGGNSNSYRPGKDSWNQIKYTVLPPAINNFQVTPEGYISGSGTSADPYIIPYNQSLKLSLSGSKAKTDANSTLQYNTSGTWNTTTSRTISNITSATKKSVTVKMRCHNSTASLSGTESSKTIHYRAEDVYTVTINNDGHGTTTPSGAQSNVGQVTGLSIEAKPAANYEFVNWTITSGSGSFGSETSASTTFKPTSDATIQANFLSTATNSLAVVAGAGIASVTGSKDPVILGNSYTITATPKTGYTFSTWTANPAANATFGSATSANTTVTVNNGSVTVTANAEEIKHAVQVNIETGQEAWGELSTNSVEVGQITKSTTITATPNTAVGYEFDHWEISEGITIVDGTENSTEITITATKAGSLTAHFRGVNRLQNVFLIGTMNGWKESDAEWQFYKLPGESGNTVTLTKTINKSDYHNDGYKFGVNIYQAGWDDKWWHNSADNDTKMDAHNCTGWVFGTKEGDKKTFIDLNVSGEYTFTLAHSGTYNQQALSITYPDKSFVEGDFEQAWNEEAYKLTENGNVQSVTIQLAAKSSVEFRLVSHGKLFGTSTKITRAANSQILTAKNMEDAGATMKFDADYAGNYEFQYNKETKKLTVIYPTIYTVNYSRVPESAADAPTTSPPVTSGNSVVAGTSITFTAQDAKTGYAWKGWYDNSEGNGTALSTNKAYTRTINADTEIYAVYTAKTSKVTLNPQPGEGGTTSVDATAGSAMPDIEIPTRHGYTFGGYYDQEAGNGTRYYNESGKSAKDWDKEGDVTLYAKWTATPYTITYNTNGGNAIANGSYTIEEEVTLPTPRKTGSTFAGWYGNSEFNGEAIATIASGSTGDKEFWAKWNIGTYAVTLDMEGGNGGTTSVQVTHGTAMPTITIPTKNDHLFDGYYDGDNGTGTKYYNADGTSAKNWNKETATLYARWIPYSQCIFFKNNLNWNNVYVYFYSSDKYWDDAKGTGSIYDRKFQNGEDANHSPHWRKFRGSMINIKGTDIWYIDYLTMAKEINNSYYNEITGYTNIAFTEDQQYDYEFFDNTEVVRRGDFNHDMQLFVPLLKTKQTADEKNKHDGKVTKYYSSGIWMKYNSTESGYDWRGSTDPNDANQWSKSHSFTTDNPGGYSFKASVTFDNVHTHYFKIHNNKGDWFGNGGTMTQKNCTDWIFGTDNGSNAQITPTITGTYIFTIYLGDGEVKVSLDYPLSTDDYRLVYVDNVTGVHPGHYIKKRNEDRLDTVSFFVHHQNSPRILLQYCYAISNSGVPTWKTYKEYQILKTGGADPTSAQLPGKRKSDAVLYIGEGCGIETSGVYNFILRQSGNDAELATDLTHAYVGDFYIRTDAADGGWDAFRQQSNKITYSSFADSHSNFNHYYCKYIEAGRNVKFTIANDYSYCISDTLDNDEIIKKGQSSGGCLPINANVRFGWDSNTNEISRAYIKGAGMTSDRFLVLQGKDGNLTDANGKDIPVGTGDRTGLLANEEILVDQQNWIYQVDVTANNQTFVKLIAEYNGTTQYFKGNETEYTRLLSSSATKNYKIRLVYDFKSNHLVIAWLAGGTVTNTEILGADMMVIRKNQERAEQLNFNPQNSSMTDVKTGYAVMTFTKAHLENLEEDNVTPLQENQKKTERERSLYWVSFPFNVKISDVFGFGEYAEHWILQYYDGAERAEKGLFSDSGTYWKYIFDTDTELKAGQGYVLVLDLSKVEFLYGATEVSLYFPSTNPLTTITGNLPTEAIVPEHWCNIDREWTENEGTQNEVTYHHKYTDSHWNLIGVPGFADINFDLNVTKYHFMQDDASFYYKFNLAESTYAVEASQVTKFQAMYAYMVQFAGTIDWTSSTVVGATPTEPKLAARRYSDDQPEKVLLRLELAQGEEVADRTFVQLQQEGATANFDLSLDLTKIVNIGVSNIYTLTDSLKIQTAGNVLPFEETTVAVGVDIATAGEYTFRMPDGTEGMVVELIDYETNTTTNLLLDDYTVNLPTGSNETRFALSLKPEKTATSIESTTTPSDSNIRKFIIDGKLYLQKDGMLYDAQGKLVR